MQTFHRFATQAEFLAACDAAGWPRDHQNHPAPPPEIALDIIGPWQDRPSVVAGIPIPGAIDGRWHVNALWPPDTTLPDAWAAAEITPATPGRAFAVPPPPAPPPPAVPAVVAAWKGRAALREAGLLDAVEAAVAAAGGRVSDAWSGAAEWHRDSDFLQALSATIGLSPPEIDALFHAADAIRG